MLNDNGARWRRCRIWRMWIVWRFCRECVGLIIDLPQEKCGRAEALRQLCGAGVVATHL